MEKVRAYYRNATPDCPVIVSYFAPVQLAQEPSHPQVSHNLTVTLMKAGQVELYTKGARQILTAGDISIIPPEQLFTFRTMTMDTRYIFLSISPQFIQLPEGHFFRRDFTDPLFGGQLQLPELIRPGDPAHGALSAALQPLNQQKEGTPEYTAQLFAAVMAFCAALRPHCTRLDQPQTPNDRAEDAVLACIAYMKAHFREKITLQALADHVHLHPNYLCALFRDTTGRTVFEYLTRFRIRYASRQLSSTTLSVAQVAEKSGFGSVSFFCRKFRAIAGYSPLQYRKLFASAAQQEPETAE